MFGISAETLNSSTVITVVEEVNRVPEKLAANTHVRFGGRVSFGWLASDFGPNGHIGDPLPATAERGKELFEGSVQTLAESLAEVREFNFGR